jgi:hypothetical protein
MPVEVADKSTSFVGIQVNAVSETAGLTPKKPLDLALQNDFRMLLVVPLWLS